MDQKQQMENILATLPNRSIQSTIFNMANAYAMASDSSWNAIGETLNTDFSAPSIMCQSFSVELLLKFFIANENPTIKTFEELKTNGIKLRGHKYSDLFDQLSVGTKEKIARAYSELSGTRTDTAEFRAALIAQGDDPFVYWRYAYETNAISHFDKLAFNLINDALGKAAEHERKIAEGLV